jgi:hypothetical protein
MSKRGPKAPTVPTLFPSMKACAGATGIPMHVLSQAKKDGCPAFHASNRVDLKLFLSWIFDQPRRKASEETMEEAARREQIARADLLELKRQEREQDLVNMAQAVQTCVDLVQPVARMVKEMPARLCQRCNPSDPALARTVLTDYAREVCEKVGEVGK